MVMDADSCFTSTQGHSVAGESPTIQAAEVRACSDLGTLLNRERHNSGGGEVADGDGYGRRTGFHNCGAVHRFSEPGDAAAYVCEQSGKSVDGA